MINSSHEVISTVMLLLKCAVTERLLDTDLRFLIQNTSEKFGRIVFDWLVVKRKKRTVLLVGWPEVNI